MFHLNVAQQILDLSAPVTIPADNWLRSESSSSSTASDLSPQHSAHGGIDSFDLSSMIPYEDLNQFQSVIDNEAKIAEDLLLTRNEKDAPINLVGGASSLKRPLSSYDCAHSSSKKPNNSELYVDEDTSAFVGGGVENIQSIISDDNNCNKLVIAAPANIKPIESIELSLCTQTPDATNNSDNSQSSDESSQSVLDFINQLVDDTPMLLTGNNTMLSYNSVSSIRASINHKTHAVSARDAIIRSRYKRYRSFTIGTDADLYTHYSPETRLMSHIMAGTDPIILGSAMRFAETFPYTLDGYFSEPMFLKNGLADTDPLCASTPDYMKIYKFNIPRLSENARSGLHIEEAIQRLDRFCESSPDDAGDGAISMLHALIKVSKGMTKCFMGTNYYGDLGMYVLSTQRDPASNQMVDVVVGMYGPALNCMLGIVQFVQSKRWSSRIKRGDLISQNLMLSYRRAAALAFIPQSIGFLRSSPVLKVRGSIRPPNKVVLNLYLQDAPK